MIYYYSRIPICWRETFARLRHTFDFSVMTKNFQNSGTTENILPRIKTSSRQIRQKPSSNLPCLRPYARISVAGRTYPITQGELQGFWLPSSD